MLRFIANHSVVLRLKLLIIGAWGHVTLDRTGFSSIVNMNIFIDNVVFFIFSAVNQKKKNSIGVKSVDRGGQLTSPLRDIRESSNFSLVIMARSSNKNFVTLFVGPLCPLTSGRISFQFLFWTFFSTMTNKN